MTLTCDLHPDCQDQGCRADPKDCRRVRDLRGGVDKRPDLTRHDAAAYKLTLKSLTTDQLFEAWWHERYNTEFPWHAALVMDEMNSRNLDGGEAINL